ncbi:hypothetical protein [Bacillus thuringiensis]|uniref:hypothetical protein n=1 Tax=Bacillus thuringiensis TaxID=1428 RepID=UPI000BF89B96|nr:hypothetical protein [Bacillus thuringiensis]MCU4986655.1 hypothetical protein [Bacillus cereus]PFF57948.1 hypothetical protein CN358_24900 [Bacillus thuringiensis]
MKIEETQRKTRSDKKKDIKPTVSINLKETISRISYITTTPVKDVAEQICSIGLYSKQVMDLLSEYFRRDLVFGNTCYIGDLERTSLQRQKIDGLTDRITIRFTQEIAEKINSLAYALDVTPSKATAILLEVSLKNSAIINKYFKMYLQEQLDSGRLKELKKIIKFINQNNPYEEEFSWTEFLSYIVEEVKSTTKNIPGAINDWIDKYK